MIWTRTNILMIVALALVEAINVASSWGDPLEIIRLTAYLVVPGKENIWPDHAEMVIWLLEQIKP